MEFSYDGGYIFEKGVVPSELVQEEGHSREEGAPTSRADLRAGESRAVGRPLTLSQSTRKMPK